MNKRGVQFFIVFLLLLIAAFLGGVFAIVLQDRLAGNDAPPPAAEETPKDLQAENFTVNTYIANEVAKAVVGVSNVALQYTWSGDVQEVEAGTGSGVIIDERGYIVTNNHVVADSSKVTVSLHDGRQFTADIVGTDVRTDLALLKINGTGLPVAALGDSDLLKVGEQAVAIGNPGGLDFAGSVTSGIISGLNRPLITEEGLRFKLIQTDAAINPGNSGGALVNSEGQVVGINTAKIAQTGFEGMGFALPANLVDDIVRELMDKGRVTRPALGLFLLRTVDADFAAYNKLDVDYGVLVSPQPSGPAAAAGLKEYDIVIAIDGEKVADVYDLQDRVFAHKVGDTVEVKVMRGKEQLAYEVKLTELRDGGMMRIKVLAIGKVKEMYLREALADYSRRIRPYARLEILEGPEEDVQCGGAQKVLAKEGEFFLRHLERDVYGIALDLDGENLTSPDLAALLEEKGNREGKEIAFLIGGSLGLSAAVKKRCRQKIAFGRATFPHQLIRVFLLEQIYRSQKIIKNEPYHK